MGRKFAMIVGLGLALAACTPAATATVTPIPSTATAVPSTATAPAPTATAASSGEPDGAQLSEQGLFRAWYTSDIEPPPVDELHTWTLHVETPEGEPVADAVITVAGDMPAHGHGLPTQPQVTQYLGDGDYLVEGMKFSMGGAWVMTFDITAGDRHDVVNFDLTLEQ